MVKRGKEKQQTLEATLGRPRVRPTVRTPKVKSKFKSALGSPASSSPAGNVKSSSRAPPSSLVFSSQVSGSAKKQNAAFDDLFSEEGSEDDDVVELPVRETKRTKTPLASGSSPDGRLPSKGEEKGNNGDTLDEEEEDDDKPLVSATPRHKRRIIADDSDDEPLVSSPVKRRRLVRRNTVSSPAAGGQHATDGDEKPAPSSTRATQTRRKPLTQKEKARELLRRKRAGETIIEEDEPSSSEGEEPVRAMYDTDSDHPALVDFEDEEEEEGVADPKGAKKKGKKPKKDKKNKKKAADDGDPDTSMDDFVVDDSDAPLGAPDDIYAGIPLEFTSHSHKPLKEHFRDAIEWLVQFKINPGFSDKEHPLYRMAWKKLDDEVRGLATSKFASAAWKKDFYMALRARPYLDNDELPKGSMLGIENCGACGRSGHPAKHLVTFTGTPYYKDTTKLSRFLDPVELDSDSDAGSESQGEDEDEDEDGNEIPKQTKQWYVGVVCNSNAETAHSLIHWKHELLDWVDTRLHQEGFMMPSKLAEREQMKPKKKHKLVDTILEKWVKDGVVKDLYHAFKGTIEKARNKSTTGRYQRG